MSMIRSYYGLATKREPFSIAVKRRQVQKAGHRSQVTGHRSQLKSYTQALHYSVPFPVVRNEHIIYVRSGFRVRIEQ